MLNTKKQEDERSVMFCVELLEIQTQLPFLFDHSSFVWFDFYFTHLFSFTCPFFILLTVDILIIKFLVFFKHINSVNHSVLSLLSFYLISTPHQYSVFDFKISLIFTHISWLWFFIVYWSSALVSSIGCWILKNHSSSVYFNIIMSLVSSLPLSVWTDLTEN